MKPASVIGFFDSRALAASTLWRDIALSLANASRFLPSCWILIFSCKSFSSICLSRVCCLLTSSPRSVDSAIALSTLACLTSAPILFVLFVTLGGNAGAIGIWLTLPNFITGVIGVTVLVLSCDKGAIGAVKFGGGGGENGVVESLVDCLGFDGCGVTGVGLFATIVGWTEGDWYWGFDSVFERFNWFVCGGWVREGNCVKVIETFSILFPTTLELSFEIPLIAFLLKNKINKKITIRVK